MSRLGRWLRKRTGLPLPDPIPDIHKPLDSVKDLPGQVFGLKEEIKGKIAHALGGDGAESAVADISRIVEPLPPDHAVAVLTGVDAFLQTGDLNHLSPLAILMEGEIRTARNLAITSADPIPDAVVAAMPAEVRELCATTKIVQVDKIAGVLNLPKAALGHLSDAGAITLIDVIAFRVVPGAVAIEDLHLWAHELWHVRQYKDWGVTEFAKKFAAGTMSFKTPEHPVNPVEDDADTFACRSFYIEKPGYLPSCQFALSQR